MTDTILQGDTVTLKSQPDVLMTVELLDGPKAYCTWFHPVTFDYQQRIFYISALKKKL